MTQVRPVGLLSPFELGPYRLRNRMVMAPMTRSRAEGGVPTSLSADYYAQRASAGLIVTEATQVSPQGVGYLGTPGIFSDAQVEGWRRVTEAVHARDGRIVLSSGTWGGSRTPRCSRTAPCRWRLRRSLPKARPSHRAAARRS